MNSKDNLFFRLLPLLVYPPEGEWVTIFDLFNEKLPSLGEKIMPAQF